MNTFAIIIMNTGITVKLNLHKFECYVTINHNIIVKCCTFLVVTYVQTLWEDIGPAFMFILVKTEAQSN